MERPNSNPPAFDRAEIEGSIQERFRKVVERNPAHPAIVTDSDSMTYEELDVRSDQVAEALRSISPNSTAPVPLLFGHDPYAIVALLGVLKAGRAYAFIDLKNPPERNTAILADLEAQVLIHSSETRKAASALSSTGVRLVETGDRPGSNGRLHEAPVQQKTSADDLAYIVFTSGSTGLPKGVMQSHRNVLHRAWSYGTTASLSGVDRLALFYSPSASGAVRDIYGSILNGCTLYPYDLRKRGLAGLETWLRDNRITVYNSVATVFRHFAATLQGASSLPELRLVQLGSETIYTSDLKLFKELLPDSCRFVARLGSSEISPICKYYVDKDTRVEFPTVPAGYPAPDVEVLIMDEDGRELPRGMEGEIVVRSRYLTTGYWKQPDLTATVLTTDSDGFSVYRSGDLGRITEDGCLLHLGRKDFQVKIDGHRVEISEIESALLHIDFIKEAAVVARPDQTGGLKLVAYVVPTSVPAPTANSIRKMLAEKLPPFMIPSVFGFIEKLPVTSSGKVDRRNLPEIEEEPPAEGDHVAPRTETEAAVARIWSEVIEIANIGVDDNLLDVSGSSLHGMRIASQIQAEFRVNLPLATVMELGSIARMAERIEALRRLVVAADSQQVEDREEGVL